MPFFYIEAYTAPSKFGPFFKYKIEVWDINAQLCTVPILTLEGAASDGGEGGGALPNSIIKPYGFILFVYCLIYCTIILLIFLKIFYAYLL